jgi:hypothetical protein
MRKLFITLIKDKIFVNADLRWKWAQYFCTKWDEDNKDNKTFSFQDCLFSLSKTLNLIHSPRSLSYDRSIAASKASPVQSVI